MINIRDFDTRLLKIDKKSYKTLAFTTLGISQRKKLMIVKILIVWILCIYLLTMQVDMLKIWILCIWILIIQVDVLKKGENKYLVFDPTDENKELLKKYNDVWNRIKSKIKEVDDSECDYEIDYMKIKFNSSDNLPLSKPLKAHNSSDLFLKKMVNFIHNFF